jgi:hypothetical protein
LEAQEVEPARFLPPEEGGSVVVGNELEEDHEEERGRDPSGGACVGSIGRSSPPMSVVVPHSHCSRPSMIFLLAADSAARSREPAPLNEVKVVILSSKYMPCVMKFI